MKPYQAVIEKLKQVPSDDIRGCCDTISQQLAGEFPNDLEVAKGLVTYNNEFMDCESFLSYHWWNVDKETGEIVDGTAHQFYDDIKTYVTVDESKGKATRCVCCGIDFAYDSMICQTCEDNGERPY